MQRGEQIALRRDRRRRRILSGAAGALFAVLALMIAVIPGKVGITSAESSYGSFILSPEAGGYVLCAVIAFALGVCVTLLCLRRRKNKPDNEVPQKQTEEESIQ